MEAHKNRNQTPHRPEEKLETVLAALRNQASLAELCRHHGISETTFYR